MTMNLLAKYSEKFEHVFEYFMNIFKNFNKNLNFFLKTNRRPTNFLLSISKMPAHHSHQQWIIHHDFWHTSLKNASVLRQISIRSYNVKMHFIYKKWEESERVKHKQILKSSKTKPPSDPPMSGNASLAFSICMPQNWLSKHSFW